MRRLKTKDDIRDERDGIFQFWQRSSSSSSSSKRSNDSRDSPLSLTSDLGDTFEKSAARASSRRVASRRIKFAAARMEKSGARGEGRAEMANGAFEAMHSALRTPHSAVAASKWDSRGAPR
ncbi:hypothetical protein V9T40_004632 [Parthenolecanium corni]|uniref:Uncharacterized protein n=1 Tax=Parthenolecanium corni TaxID=536013 RepID=A0AAN9Y225_9HEMI